MSNDDYEAFHHSWIKAIKVLPVNAVLYKQDWFTEEKYQADFLKEDNSFLGRSSERFFNERPYVNHECYIMLTKKTANRKASSSVFSSLLKRTIVPEETLQLKHYQDFINNVGQFEKILSDSGIISFTRLNNSALITMEGFTIFCNSKGLVTDLKHYYANTREAYNSFIDICRLTKAVIREDQISGGMFVIYNPSITQRLNNLTERVEQTRIGQPMFPLFPEVDLLKLRGLELNQ